MNVLCIATHPDDESLGCGGTLLRHRKNGDTLFWLIVTQAGEPLVTAEMSAIRAAQMKRIEEAFGFARVVRLGFPAAALDRVPEGDLIRGVAGAVADLSPDVIYMNHGGDAHSDHRVAFQACMAALKTFRLRRPVHRVLTYETLSETEQAPALGVSLPFQPTTFVDISAEIDRKVELMSIYTGEMQPFPFPREESAIRALARYRGAQAGVGYAEAFSLMREVW
ncbi:PIG-L deacetylase family protein [Azospirillum soli]|uniref:PIG-L deacetylase family protein n=1 Tax=Azospirillum soli TaxID=1304799 RepID=UPI001AE60B71|nr:PIG-L deacetylase family protein [Azospirillum soli]MBP2316259.1 LmbE family N-acetylglucosaminyl deacetylase [Azospirillum soli]